MVKNLLIGTRSSPLAMIQTKEVLNLLQKLNSGITFDIIEINSVGDNNPDVSINSLGKGVFVSELEKALVNKHIDIAIHSLKDLPIEQSDILGTMVVCHREDSRDVFISKFKCALEDIPTGSRIGTSSPRRKVQILSIRPDIIVSEIRGNIGTRLNKVGTSDYDGIVVAAAGINRLGYQDCIDQYFDTQIIIPEPGQGALAVQFRNENRCLESLLTQIEHYDTKVAIREEMNFVKEIGGGCKIPIAAHAEVTESMIKMDGMMVSSNGIDILREYLECDLDKYENTGNTLAKKLLSKIR